MTRLFLRFYLGVIVILIAAWLIQAFAFRRSSIEANIPVIESVYASSARLARDRIIAAGPEELTETMDYLQSRFDYPIRVVDRDKRPMDATNLERLDRGESLLYLDLLETAIPDSPFLVELGPLPRFGQPSQLELMFALGGLFVLTALGIAFLLRPVIVQLRCMEKTALAIAAGDLRARIDDVKFPHSVPLAGAFNAMADRVEQLLQTQRELLQTVSHELRTPLARIKFATELVASADNDDQRNQRLSAIEAATDQLNELVGELLAYVRMDAEHGNQTSESITCEMIDIPELVGELIDLHGPLHPSIEFTVDLSNAGGEFCGDRAAIARAVGNLISNAGKFARSKVIVAATRTENQLCFAIMDDGSGIAEEDRETVFQPFKRLSGVGDASAGAAAGTGLGLALVERIAQRNGGRVSVSNSELGGAMFRLTLPNSNVAQASVP